MKCHGKFYSLCQSLLSNLWWPTSVETHSLLFFFFLSLCWLLSVSTKLSRLAAGMRVVIFWVLRPSLPREAWLRWLEWAEATGVTNFWLFLTCHTSASVWLTGEYSWCRGCILESAKHVLWKTNATLISCWIYSKYQQPKGKEMLESHVEFVVYSCCVLFCLNWEWSCEPTHMANAAASTPICDTMN